MGLTGKTHIWIKGNQKQELSTLEVHPENLPEARTVASIRGRLHVSVCFYHFLFLAVLTFNRIVVHNYVCSLESKLILSLLHMIIVIWMPLTYIKY